MSNIKQSETKKVNLGETGNITALEHKTSMVAPIPDPKSMAEYQSIQPDFAIRLMEMAEKEQKHRHDTNWKRLNIENDWKNEEITIKKRGQWFAFSSAISTILLCGFGFYLGFSTAAATIATAVIVAIAGVFLYPNRKINNKEIEKAG